MQEARSSFVLKRVPCRFVVGGVPGCYVERAVITDKVSEELFWGEPSYHVQMFLSKFVAVLLIRIYLNL